MIQRLLAFACLLAVIATVGCRRDNQIVVPNRVLDRPLDATLTCMRRELDGTITALAVSACDVPTAPPCSDNDANDQLIGFIANSERNEVAMVRRCDTTAAVVDMDGDTPGYQLIPVGQLPSSIMATELGCRVVTSNAGSCDLSILDAPGLATFAIPPLTDSRATTPPPDPTPSSLVSKLVPLRSDGTPLGSRPGVILSAPDELSLAAALDGGGQGGDGGLLPEGEGEFSLCPPGKSESAWMTFPTCQLVAELSLNTGQILQSRRFVTAADGSVSLEDAGTEPACPIDCPIQFDEGAPPTCTGEGEPGCRDPVDPDGYFPTALELVVPPDVEQPDSADLDLDYPALFVGGLGSDTLFEIQFEGDPGSEDGLWEAPEEALSLTLENARGVHGVRATPPVIMAGGGVQGADSHQFLYVAAGDGATHVVDRSYDRAAFGNECDTQIDPTVQAPPYPSCNPIDPNTVGQTPSPERRPFALGPGIRASLGAAITDWAFYKVREDPQTMQAEQGDGSVPFDSPGVVGIGITSFGRVVVSVFSQMQNVSPFNDAFDPAGIMNLSVPPHSLWPRLNPLGTDPAALPRVGDNEPDRALPGADDTAQVLAPSIRRVDFAYSDAPDADTLSESRQALADALGNQNNADALGRFDGEGLYANEVARVVVRDYMQWTSLEWSLVWEGSIPGTRSTTGRIECDAPGHAGGTCLDADENGVLVPGRSRLVDESAAFCDSGVLPGDKVVLLGCTADDDCGLGQKCLQEPTAPSSAGGICVSEQAFEKELGFLRQACAPFINEPCGDPRREYVVTDAFQNELWLRPTDRLKTSHLISVVDPETDEASVFELEDRFTCALPYTVDTSVDPELVCTSDADCRGGAVPQRCDITDAAFGPGADVVVGGVCRPLVLCDDDADCGGDEHSCDNGVCRGPCTGGDPECFECATDDECEHFGPLSVCSDARCRRPCESGDRDCLLAPLPGPRCFPELIDYVVRVRNSFLVEGAPTVSFIPDRVIADPETGRCREDPTVSTLLTSRIRLGEDQAETFGGADYPFVIPDCPNADEAAPTDPNPCRITRLREEDETSRFHRFSYEGQPVAAIRFSNPFMSLVVDLTDLRGLASEVDQFPGQRFGPEFVRFRRGRIPRGYRETFVAAAGYAPFSEPVIVGNTVMVYPVRIFPGPEQSSAFIVDAGGRGGPAGVRGQLIRIIASLIDQGGIEDQSFRVR